MDEGAVGALDTWQRGDDGLRSFGTDASGVIPMAILGELPPSDTFRSWSKTETRVGEEGYVSSTGFRGRRIRLGEPKGLCGRIWGENNRWPVALVLGIDWVRAIGGARLAADRDLTWPLDNGDDARGR